MVGSVTFSGLGSGLPADLVDRLLAAESSRLSSLEETQKQYETQKKAYSELRSKFLTLRSKSQELKQLSLWSPHQASTSAPDQLGVTASNSALAAVHQVDVQRLATTNSQVSTFRVTDQNATLTAGRTLSFTYNGNPYSVNLDAGSTLRDVATKINGIDFGSEAGVSASVLNDGTGYRLVLNAKESGAYQRDGAGNTTAERIGAVTLNADVTFSDATLFSAAGALSLTQSGVDAKLRVDGVDNIFSSSNTVSEVITGVTLELKGVTTATASVSITNDTASVASKVQGFVDTYNSIVDYIAGKKDKGEEFAGESTVRNLITQMRAEFNTVSTGAAGNFTTLASLGVTTDWETGKLSLDTGKLNTALTSDFNAGVDVFAVTDGNQGLAYRLDTLINKLTDSTSGTIAGKTKGLDSRIEMYQNRIDREESRLERLRDYLTDRYARLDSLVSSLNNAGNMMMSSLSKF